MSISSGGPSTASDDDTAPPYSATEVALSDWPTETKGAWNAFHTVKQGHTVRWADRSQPLEVVSVSETEDGLTNVEVEGPRGGSYLLRERYDDAGNPKFYADDSKAMDLEVVEGGSTAENKPFTDEMYENVVRNLVRASVNAYASEEYDYNRYPDAARAVVGQWVKDVEFQRWNGWPYQWDDEDPQYIFRMVREHSGRLPETGDGSDPPNPQQQAREILEQAVINRGKEMAHEQLITSEDDYAALVEELAADSVERDDVKINMDARQATQSVVDDFIDAHTDPVYRSIIQHSYSEPMDFELYEGLDDDQITREMAYDLLDQDVWQRVRDEQKERGRHDPTVRGIAFYEYDQLVETLVEETLKEHRINDNQMLYSTTRGVVRNFADTVENHEWPYDFGGISEGAWGDGDVEDIFTSITMHSEVDPQMFNPFASDKERKMATQVLSEVVHERASNALDDDELAAVDPVPADEYLRDQLGMDMTFNDIRNDSGVSPQQYIRDAVQSLDGGEMESLAGWTFVDELVEEADATVPFMADSWVLVDYGLVKTDQKARRLAWFDRDTGNVLVLTGTTTNPPADGEYGFEDFNVLLLQWQGDDEPNFLAPDVSLEYAFTFCRDYLGADSVDVNIIETADGEHYIQEAITEDDIDTRAFTSIAPSFSMPGPGYSVEDTVAYGGEAFRNVGRWLQSNSRVVEAMTTTGVVLAMGEASNLLFKFAPGLNVQPDVNKQFGVGLKASYNFGQSRGDLEEYDPSDPSSDPYTGNINANVRITPGTFKFLGDAVTPNWVYETGPGPDNVISTLENTVTKPLRDNTGDYFRRYRAAFLAAHMPEEPRGRPTGEDAFETPRTLGVYNGYEIEAHYETDPGGTLSEEAIRDHLRHATVGGYIADNGYYWEGDAGLRARLSSEEVDLYDKPISPAAVNELGWSLDRSALLSAGETLVGSEEEVAQNWASSTGPVVTYQTFIKLFREFPGAPSMGILEQVWKFYVARAEDTDDGEFTLFDAYDRFRMMLTYNAVNESMRLSMGDYLYQHAKADNLSDVFQNPGSRLYYWSTAEPDTEHVFGGQVSEVPEWIVFPEDGPTPPSNVEYVYHDGTPGGEFRKNVPGGTDQRYIPDVPKADDDQDIFRDDDDEGEWAGRSRYDLSTWNAVFKALTRSAQTDISEMVDDEEDIAVEPADWQAGRDPEEKRPWLESDSRERIRKVASGSVNWDDLDGTDLSVFGLFLRGLDMKTAAQLDDHWNLTDRFQTNLARISPVDFRPSRPDWPDFEDWLDRRRGKNAVGSASEKAKAKARYLREMSENIPGVQSREELGVDMSEEAEIERMRDVREHHEDTDYEDYQNFYANEFGNAFDDVSAKFNEQRPMDADDELSPNGQIDTMGNEVETEPPDVVDSDSDE